MSEQWHESSMSCFAVMTLLCLMILGAFLMMKNMGFFLHGKPKFYGRPQGHHFGATYFFGCIILIWHKWSKSGRVFEWNNELIFSSSVSEQWYKGNMCCHDVFNRMTSGCLWAVCFIPLFFIFSHRCAWCSYRIPLSMTSEANFIFSLRIMMLLSQASSNNVTDARMK